MIGTVILADLMAATDVLKNKNVFIIDTNKDLKIATKGVKTFAAEEAITK